MEIHEIHHIKTRIERVQKRIKEKQKQIEDFNHFINGHSSDAYALQEEIEDLLVLIVYDQEYINNNTVKERFTESLQDKPKLKDVPKGTPLEDLF
tara:strand:- start:140 stop:424 length:285 start_codon:yes stop_codon:yes gene_type:complete